MNLQLSIGMGSNPLTWPIFDGRVKPDGRHPWAILNLLKALGRANDIAERERLEHAQYHLDAGLLPPEAAQSLRSPLVRHDIEANLLVLETAAAYSHEQGLTPRRVNLEELFAESTLEQ